MANSLRPPARGSVDLELERMLLFTVSLSTSAALALQPPLATRRQAVAGAAGCMLEQRRLGRKLLQQL